MTAHGRWWDSTPRRWATFDAWWLYNAFMIGVLVGLAVGVFLW